MDAKSRDLALLSFLSLSCAASAWAGDRDIFGSVFFALGTIAMLGAAYGQRADMDKDYLTLKRASASRLSGEWSEDDYDVLCEGAVVGRIMKAAAAPVDAPWLWTLAYGHHEDRTPTHGYEPTREAAFAKSWRRE
jgi:hypothetical protein